MDWTNITTGNSSAAFGPPLTLEKLKAFADKFKREERDILRAESLMIEQMKCPKCGRKPTVTGTGITNTTYVVCPHIWQALKERYPQTEPPGRSPDGRAPLGWSPFGVSIEVMDDGPIRW